MVLGKRLICYTILYSALSQHICGGEPMKRHQRKRGCRIGVVLALVAFLGALMCISFFSVKVLLTVVAILLIVIGIYLMRL